MDVVLEKSGRTFKGIRLQTSVLLLTSIVVFLNFTTVFEIFGIQDVVISNDTDIQYDYEDYVDENSGSAESIEATVEIGEEHYLHESEIAFLPLLKPLNSSNHSQEVSKFKIQSAFFIGVLIGFLGTLLSNQRFSPKFTLLIGLTGNAVTLIINDFMTSIESFVVIRAIVGIFAAVSVASLIILLLSWSHASNQSLALHHLLSMRGIATIIVGIVLFFIPRGTAIYYIHPVLLGIVFILNLIFVTSSPDWIRERGHYREYSELVSKLATTLRVAVVDINADEKKPPSPERILPLIVALAVYFFTAIFSFTIQSSEGYYFSWSLEIIILGGLYIVAAVFAIFVHKLIRVPLFLFNVSAVILTVTLFILPWGIAFDTILQVTKFNTALNDHFVIFFVVNAVVPEDSRYSATALRSYRTKLALSAESVATVSRTLALFFVLKSDYSESLDADQIPKLIVAVISGILVILLIILSFIVAPKKTPQHKNAELEELMPSINGNKPGGGTKRPQSIYVPESKAIDIDI